MLIVFAIIGWLLFLFIAYTYRFANKENVKTINALALLNLALVFAFNRDEIADELRDRAFNLHLDNPNHLDGLYAAMVGVIAYANSSAEENAALVTTGMGDESE